MTATHRLALGPPPPAPPQKAPDPEDDNLVSDFDPAASFTQSQISISHSVPSNKAVHDESGATPARQQRRFRPFGGGSAVKDSSDTKYL